MPDITELTDSDIDRLVDELIPALRERGPVLGDHVLLTRRQAVAIAASAGGAGLLSAFGVETAQAQTAVGQLGTASNRVSVFAATADAAQFDLDGDTLAQAVVASGSVALSGGEATTSTGITASGATFYPAIGVDDPGADVTGLAAQLDFDNASGEYELTVKETGTSQNPTVNYDIVRVR